MYELPETPGTASHAEGASETEDSSIAPLAGGQETMRLLAVRCMERDGDIIDVTCKRMGELVTLPTLLLTLTV